MIEPTPKCFYLDLTGHRQGRLVAVRVSGRTTDGHVRWECRCDCGGTANISSQSLVRKYRGTRSCGCLRREAAAKRNKNPWNKGKTYAHVPADGSERIYSQKHSWAKAVIRANGPACQLCGWKEARCDVHHRVPRSAGGTMTISNGIVVCPNCHRVWHERSARAQ